MSYISWAFVLVLAVAWSAAAVAESLELGPGYADGCTPPKLESWPVGPPRVPHLSPKEKPNFIVIQVDDMGWDDIGLHHPRGPDGVSSAGAQTPNIDKLIKSGMSFTNFYTAPLCAMGRAQLLTGRDYPRTGNLFNGHGFDAIHLGEATMGNVMQQAGYVTGHYGKWHNSRTLGYEPWWRGFNESWMPSDTYLQVDNLMRHNGKYVQTRGLVEQIMADKIIGFLKDREQDKQPFLTYYAPYAIHAIPFKKNQPDFDWVGQVQHNKTAHASIYFQPEPYKSIILNQQPPPGEVNARVWAFLMYLDDVLGKIFDYIDSSPLLRQNTYIMLTSDNGPALPFVGDKKERLQRLPSGMAGDKNKFEGDGSTSGAGMEGSLRNHLAVWGPGVPSGGVSDTLLSLADVLPTIAELADATETKHEPWSGRSFANLLQPNGSPTPEQERRFHFTFVSSGKPQQCPAITRLMSRTLPTLGPDREVLKPQPMMAYTDNGVSIMKHCIVGRYGEYKWHGMNDKVYRLANGSHIELPCNEVLSEQQRKDAAAQFNEAAEAWWNSVIAERHSFTKPVYLLGLPGFARPADEPTNVEAAGIVALRRGGSMVLNSIVNFTSIDDYGCWKIRPVTAGTYRIMLMYFAKGFAGLSLVFRMDIWQYGIARRRAFSLVKTVDSKVGGDTFTVVNLPASDGKTASELCLRIMDLSPEDSGTPSSNATAVWASSSRNRQTWARQNNMTSSGWVFRLANIRFVPVENRPGAPTVPGAGRRPGRSKRPAAAASAAMYAATATEKSVPFGMPSDALGASSTSAEPATYTHFKPSPAMLDFERLVRQEAITDAQQGSRSAASADIGAVAASNSPQGKWQQLRQKYNWMEGQMVFRSLFRLCVDDAAPGCIETCG